MIIKAAYYPHQLPTKIVLELPDGSYKMTDLSPFRAVTEDELAPVAFFRPVMGDEIPDYTLRLYFLSKQTDPILKRLRVSAGITQRGLADAAGLNLRQLQKIESGEIKIQNITLANAKKLADALGVKMEDLLAVPEE